MSPAGDWLEQLEARLEQQLDAFLRAHPSQGALLEDQEQAERQQRQRQQLQQAAALRSQLLSLAAEIRQWRELAQRARAAGAIDLAQRAEQRLLQLMEQGRQHWQRLEVLGRQLDQGKPPEKPAPDWASWELDQELEALRRRQRTP